MSDGTDRDNAYLNRLLQRAQEMSSRPEAYGLTQHIARQAEELLQRDDATAASARRRPPSAEIEAEASPIQRRGLRM